jgi:hypothetical protein
MFRRRQSEQAKEFFAGEFRLQVYRDVVYQLIEKQLLLPEDLVDPLFNRTFKDVLIHVDREGLAETVDPVLGLTLYRGIPPSIKVEDIRGVLQIQTLSTGAERKHKNLSLCVFFEFFDCCISL